MLVSLTLPSPKPHRWTMSWWLHGIAIAVTYSLVWHSGMPYGLKAIFLAGLLGLWWWPSHISVITKASASVTKLEWRCCHQQDRFEWQLEDAQGRLHQATCTQLAKLGTYWLRLDFTLQQPVKGQLSVALWRHQVPAELWRRLQVLARFIPQKI